MYKEEFSKKEKIEILEKNIDYIYQNIKKIGNYTLEGLKNASLALINFEKLKKELEEYNVAPEILREVLLAGQMARHNPTLEEVKQEWEEKGWKFTISNREIEIEDTKSLSNIYIDRKDKMFWCTHYLPFDLIQLLTKTFRALR